MTVPQGFGDARKFAKFTPQRAYLGTHAHVGDGQVRRGRLEKLRCIRILTHKRAAVGQPKMHRAQRADTKRRRSSAKRCIWPAGGWPQANPLDVTNLRRDGIAGSVCLLSQHLDAFDQVLFESSQVLQAGLGSEADKIGTALFPITRSAGENEVVQEAAASRPKRTEVIPIAVL